MGDADVQALIASIGAKLAAHGFRAHRRSRMDALGCAAFWRRCTWNTNRGVALLQRPEGDFLIGQYCQQMKWRLLWLTRFVPFFYELGLQVVLCGDGLERLLSHPNELRANVDAVSNQCVVLQSIFVVDTQTRRFASARTWGQVITGPFQNAIASGIQQAGYTVMDSD